MTDIRNILLIGKTGAGKTTLVNTITGTEKFKEGKYGTIETKKIQIKEFETEDGIRYKIIDTIDMSIKRMSLEQLLHELEMIGHLTKDGLSQIFLVTDGKLVEEVKSTYDLLEKVVFDLNITQYTTIIRTKFNNFEDEEECSEDREKLIINGGEFREVIKEFNRIIHVDNPPTDVVGKGKKIERQKELNVAIRKSSRKILLEHLVTCKCIYKPVRISEYAKRETKSL
jgi:energy-coupling factor transporter ATP-binding protein EcfA2